MDNTYGDLLIFLEIVLFYLQLDQNSMLVYIFWLGIVFYIIVHWIFTSIATHGHMLVEKKLYLAGKVGKGMKLYFPYPLIHG